MLLTSRVEFSLMTSHHTYPPETHFRSPPQKKLANLETSPKNVPKVPTYPTWRSSKVPKGRRHVGQFPGKGTLLGLGLNPSNPQEIHNGGKGQVLAKRLDLQSLKLATLLHSPSLDLAEKNWSGVKKKRGLEGRFFCWVIFWGFLGWYKVGHLGLLYMKPL